MQWIFLTVLPVEILDFYVVLIFNEEWNTKTLDEYPLLFMNELNLDLPTLSKMRKIKML